VRGQGLQGFRAGHKVGGVIHLDDEVGKRRIQEEGVVEGDVGAAQETGLQAAG
jgi:hypothetical protein